MKYMGFSYDEKGKSYFSYCHEDNKKCRKKIIKEYFKLEKRTYQWIQISELLKNTYFEYKKMI